MKKLSRFQQKQNRGSSMLKASGLLVALIGVFTLTGCSLTDKVAEKATEKATEKVLEMGTDSQVDLEEGQISITTESGETINIGENVKLPDSFPSDVPVYTKAEVMSSFSSGNTHTATLTSSKDFSTIKDYYKSELESQGWTIDSTSNLNFGGQSTTYLCSQDDRTLIVGIFDYEESGSDEITITLSVE